MSSFPSAPKVFLALLLVAAAAPACTASDADATADGDESDLRIKPKDSENLARLTVTTPSGWTLPVNPNDDGTVSYRSAQIPFNAAQRLQAGDGWLQFTGKFDQYFTPAKITLEKGKSTSFDLGSMKPTFTAATDPSSTLRRDFGPTPALSVFFSAQAQGVPNESQIYGQSRSQTAFWNGNPQRALLAPPGDYRFSWGLPILSDVKKTLAGGENATINLAPSDQRATIVIKKPAARELPDAPVPQCHMATRTFLVHRRVDNTNGQSFEPASYDQRNTALGNVAIQDGYNSYSSSYDQVTSWAALPMKDDTTVKVFPFAQTEGANHYELVVNNVATTLALKPGDTKTIQLERLDVDDVEVTKENGDTYTVKGTWQLYRQGPNNTWLPITYRQDCSNGGGTQATFPTSTGIDVMPGTYRLVISYSTAEGAKTQDQTITVP